MGIFRQLTIALPLLALAACGEISYVQKNSPASAFKNYRPENQNNAAVLGIGEPISTRQMRANATFSMKGLYNIEDVMQKMAGTYNVAVRWGNGVRKGRRVDVLLNKLSFDEARSYVEDVYKVQIIREGDRRLLVLPSASEPRVQAFNPGDDVTLAVALRGLSQQCGYNVVISDNQEKVADTRVSTNLKDVTCYDAFEALLNPHGLSLVNEGDYFTISGLPQQQWNVGLDEPVRAEELEVTYSTDFSSSGSEESSSMQSSGGSSKVKVTSERDLWKELEGDLNALIVNNCSSSVATTPESTTSSSGSSLLPPPTLSGVVQNQEVGDESSSVSSEGTSGNPECGYVRVNRAVGLVQMRAPKRVLDQADDIISRVQDIASRRLMLEARVMAVSRSRGFEQAAKFNFNKGDGFVGFSGAASSVTAALAGRLLNIEESGGYAAARSQSLEAMVRLLEQYGTTYELMHPMVELMDRQRATLIDGRNERYFIREIETETLDNGSVLRNLKAQERMQFVGLQFSASAQISNDEDPHTVRLQIPITSIAKNVALRQRFDGEEIIDQIPVATTRLIDQKVRVRDGEIKVIGGLTKTMAVDRESGQPLIREVPAVGKLFNDENVTFEEVEFVVLLQVRRLT
ncbi:MAG: secretin N-terminal domain-containing protein [Pseudomonadaceae bacterium]|nr:secretin N-terminal domain-containing protein [Pseudomonadaceae bacterium]